jgi:hypothetical protein
MRRTNTQSQRLTLTILFTGATAILVGVFGTGRREGVLDSLRAELIPKYGQQTDYGIPLDLRNAAHFVDWFYTIERDESEQALKDSALGAPVPPAVTTAPPRRAAVRATSREARGVCLPTSSRTGCSRKRASARRPSTGCDSRDPTTTSPPLSKRAGMPQASPDPRLLLSSDPRVPGD